MGPTARDSGTEPGRAAAWLRPGPAVGPRGRWWMAWGQPRSCPDRAEGWWHGGTLPSSLAPCLCPRLYSYIVTASPPISSSIFFVPRLPRTIGLTPATGHVSLYVQRTGRPCDSWNSRPQVARAARPATGSQVASTGVVNVRSENAVTHNGTHRNHRVVAPLAAVEERHHGAGRLVRRGHGPLRS